MPIWDTCAATIAGFPLLGVRFAIEPLFASEKLTALPIAVTQESICAREGTPVAAKIKLIESPIKVSLMNKVNLKYVLTLAPILRQNYLPKTTPYY